MQLAQPALFSVLVSQFFSRKSLNSQRYHRATNRRVESHKGCILWAHLKSSCCWASVVLHIIYGNESGFLLHYLIKCVILRHTNLRNPARALEPSKM
jgi:hypothetical protein